MPGDVTEELCQARIQTINSKLDAIQQNGEETRKGVGKLMQRLFEGNGGEALDVQIHKNTDYRLVRLREQEAARDAARNHRWRTRLSWSIAIGGWVFGVIVLAVGLMNGA